MVQHQPYTEKVDQKTKIKNLKLKTSVDLEPFKNIPQKCLVNKEDYIISLLSGNLNNSDPNILFKLITIIFLCRKICENIWRFISTIKKALSDYGVIKSSNNKMKDNPKYNVTIDC